MYTFRKSQKPDSVSGSHICNIYEFSKDYNRNMALFPGQLKTLFGEPIFISEKVDNLLEYAIDATDESGNTLLLSIYSAGSGPAIGGLHNKDEKAYQKAAKELAAYIRQAEAADYDYEGYYLDGPTKIKMGVKNGIPYYEETEISDEEAHEIFKRWFES